jgi:tetratricopeptide (TPR) repeat protein
MRTLAWILLLAGCAGCQENGRRVLAEKSGDATLMGKLWDHADRIPDDPQLLESAAKLFHQQGQYPRAVDLYRRLLELDPKRCDVMQLRAQAFLSLEDEAAAFDSLRSCAQACPKDTECLFTLGGLLASRHPQEAESLSEAVRLWEKYLAAAEDSKQKDMVRRALPRLRQQLEKKEERDKTDKPVNSP